MTIGTIDWKELTVAIAAIALALVFARQWISSVRSEIRDLRRQRDRLTGIVEKTTDTLRQLSQYVNEDDQEE